MLLDDPGRPGPLPVAVSVGRAGFCRLALGGAELSGDLGLRQLGGDHRHALPGEGQVFFDQRLGYYLSTAIDYSPGAAIQPPHSRPRLLRWPADLRV